MGTHWCPECGSRFYVGQAGWGYAYDEVYCCTYHCMRRMEAKDRMIEENRHKLSAEEMAQIDKMTAEGIATPDIAKKLGVRRQQVAGYIGGKKRKLNRAPQEAEEMPEPGLEEALAELPETVLEAPQEPPREKPKQPVEQVIMLMMEMLKTLQLYVIREADDEQG